MRIALGIEYNGTGYFGWQRQREVNSIQGELERALAKVANEPIETFCAGRTDAGVNATGQVVHFDTTFDGFVIYLKFVHFQIILKYHQHNLVVVYNSMYIYQN